VFEKAAMRANNTNLCIKKEARKVKKKQPIYLREENRQAGTSKQIKQVNVLIGLRNRMPSFAR